MRKQSPNYQNYHRCHLRFSFRHQEFTLKHISLKKIFGVHSCLSLTVLFDLIVIPMEIDEIYLCLKSWCGALSLMHDYKKSYTNHLSFRESCTNFIPWCIFCCLFTLKSFSIFGQISNRRYPSQGGELYLSFRSDWPLLHLQWCLLGQSA